MTECKCWLEAGVETKMVSSDISPNPEEGNWVVYVGYVERCKRCKSPLGDGYGDPSFYPTKEEAIIIDRQNHEIMRHEKWMD